MNGCVCVYGTPETDGAAETAPGISAEVTVAAGDLTGRGTFLELDGTCVVVTAAHIFEYPEKNAWEKPEILLENGTVVTADRYVTDNERDLALIFPDEAEDGPCCPAECPAIGTAEELGRDSAVFLYDTEWRLCQGSLVETGASIENLGDCLLYFLCDVEPGMSGAGIYDETGRYVGMLIGGTEDARAAGIPVREMEAFYNTVSAVR